MNQPPIGLPWSAGEAAAVNEFLNSPLGRKWLGILNNRKPRIDLTSGDRAGLTGAFAAGYEHFFAEIAATRIATQPESFSAKGIDPVKD
jgi:hypothetical protein